MSRWPILLYLALALTCTYAIEKTSHIERGFDIIENRPRMHIFDFSSNIIHGQNNNILPTPAVFIPSINKDDFIIGYDMAVLRQEVSVTQFNHEWNVEELPVDTFFTTIINLLPKRIEKAADQQLYQDFVSTFGTHALNNCSFGGKIIVSLHIQKGYFETKTSSFIIKQAERLVTQRIYSLIGEKTHFENIDSEFAAHCFVDVEFEGGNESASENEWISTLSQNPKAIECNGPYIYEIVRDVDVKKNLKVVLEKYLGNNKRSGLVAAQAGATNLPGIEKFGFGLDITNGLNRLNVFDFDYTSGKTWNEFAVPDGCEVAKADLSGLRGTWVFEDVNKFIEWQAQRASTSPQGGVFSQTEEVKSFINQYFEKMNSHTVSLDYVVSYQITLDGAPKLHTFFQAAIDSMPASYGDIYKKYVGDGFSGWGTHYSYEAIMGGMARYDAYYSSCMIKANSTEYLTKQGGIQFGIMSSKNSWTSSSELLDSYYERNAMSVASFVGGNSVLSVSQWDQWRSTVANNPERIYFKLSPIANLIDDPTKKANWNQAVQEVQQAAQQKADQLKLDSSLKPKVISGALETRDPNVVVTMGSSAVKLGPGQNFSPATYHASLVCSRDSNGNLIASLTRNQQTLGTSQPVMNGCAQVTAVFTVDSWSVQGKGYCCFPPSKFANEGGLVVKECELA